MQIFKDEVHKNDLVFDTVNKLYEKSKEKKESIQRSIKH